MQIRSVVAVQLLGALGLVASCQTTSVADVAPPSPEGLAITRLEQERADTSQFAPWLKNSDANVRVQTVTALARLEHTSALPPLLAAMDDADARVRAAAAFGLGQLDLALDAKTDAHEAVRAQAEKRLIAALATEANANVRRVVIRSLGRVSAGPGLDALMALAASPPDAANALISLGVSGARRQASRSADAHLIAAVAAGLSSTDEAVTAGAAYAAFRQKLALPQAALTAGVTTGGTQARIFLMRAAPAQGDAEARFLVEAGLRDPEWRVQVEALRAAGKRKDQTAAIATVIETASARLAAGGPGALNHVVRDACDALEASGAGPAPAKKPLNTAVVSLAASGHAAVACTCAIALDVIDPAARATDVCPTASEALASRVKARVAGKARVSSKERAMNLSRFLSHDDVKVRMAAAGALVDDGTADSAAPAVKRLETETDFGVTSTLLELVVEDHAALVSDDLLAKLAQRFATGASFEQVEPLVSVAKIARRRETESSRTLLAQLASHTEPRVRDAASGVLSGDREPGPRASVLPTPRPQDLPLFALLKTARGDVRVAFDREHAPLTVANFVTLARAGFYNGTPFHRVIGDFVAQGGDRRGDGAGGPGYTIPCENSDEEYTRGAIGMAHAGKDTGGSQFFFTHSWQPHLDGRYTLFARVVDGLDVVDAIEPDDLLLSVDFLNAAPPR